jgi:glycosyltransferase involved in cell wall biosynthesis
MQSLSLKEKIFFTLTRFTLSRMDVVCFSTEWQRTIWCRAYGIPKSKTHVVENALPMISETPAVQQKKFLWAGRDIPLKNLPMLRAAFAEAAERAPDISLEIITGISHEELVEKMKTTYALLLPSLTDISPNFILEGVSYGKPFVMTSETGMRERLHGLGIFIDPQNKAELVHAILDMTDPEIYEQYRKRIEEFPSVRTYVDIADELIGLILAIK